MDFLDDSVSVTLVSLVYCLVLLRSIFLCKVNLCRHERTVLFDNLTCAVLICELKTVVV